MSDSRTEALQNSPRCLAQTRRGTECQSPAMKDKKRCRLHGSGGAPKGNQNRFKHGLRSRRYAEDRKLLREMIAMLRAL